MEEQIEAVLPAARQVPAGDGLAFAVYEDPSGASLWVEIVDGAVVGAHPFFAAAAVQNMRVEGAEADLDSRMDGQARLFVVPGEEVMLPVDVVNWPLAEPALRPQAVVPARLAGFAESLTAWPTVEAYESTHPESRHQGHRWIVPTGLFPQEKGGTGRATALITGIVRGGKERVNAATGAPFLSMRIETSGMTLDVVAAPETAPVEGGVVQGHFWLAALVEPVEPDSLLKVNLSSTKE